MNITVLGAGAWGTALAIHAAASHRVTLWARDATQSTALATDRVNTRYLSGVALPASLHLAGGHEHLATALEAQDLIIIATPMSGLRGMLQTIVQVAGATQTPVAWLCKGFEAPQKGHFQSSFGLLGHEIRAQVAPYLIGSRTRPADGPGCCQRARRRARCTGSGLSQSHTAHLRQ